MNESNPTPPPSSSCCTVRRRDALFGGLGLVTGLAGGVFGGAAASRKYPETVAPIVGSPRVGRTGAWEEAVYYSFSQCGEDIITSWLLTKTPLTIEKPSYLDIGTHEPVVSNNTYMFYTLGGRGVLMEPNPALSDAIRKARPEDKLLVAGVGIDDSEGMDFYMFNDSQLNTFDKEYAEKIMKLDRIKLEKVVKLPLININKVIAEHMGGKAPDLLSIDVEGLDLAILKTLDFDKYRPKVICTETIITTRFKREPGIPKLLESKGYEVWGMTFANTIFLDTKVIPPS